MGRRQCLPLSKHCRKSHYRNGVVDISRLVSLCMKSVLWYINQPVCIPPFEKRQQFPLNLATFNLISYTEYWYTTTEVIYQFHNATHSLSPEAASSMFWNWAFFKKIIWWPCISIINIYWPWPCLDLFVTSAEQFSPSISSTWLELTQSFTNSQICLASSFKCMVVHK